MPSVAAAASFASENPLFPAWFHNNDTFYNFVMFFVRFSSYWKRKKIFSCLILPPSCFLIFFHAASRFSSTSYSTASSLGPAPHVLLVGYPACDLLLLLLLALPLPLLLTVPFRLHNLTCYCSCSSPWPPLSLSEHSSIWSKLLGGEKTARGHQLFSFQEFS